VIFKAIFLNEHELQGYIVTALYESGTGFSLSSSSRQYFFLIHITLHYAFYTEYCESHSLKIYFCIKCSIIMYVYRNGRCIKKQAVCDGLDDCGDKTDEKSCPPYRRQDKFWSPFVGWWHWGAENIQKYFYQKWKLRMYDTSIVKPAPVYKVFPPFSYHVCSYVCFHCLLKSSFIFCLNLTTQWIRVMIQRKTHVCLI